MPKKKSLSLAKAWKAVRNNRRSGLAGLQIIEPPITQAYTRAWNTAKANRRAR